MILETESPLVLCLTNNVAVNFNANCLLAIGASPIMSCDKREIDELVEQCDALYINIGTIDPAQEECMAAAAARANALGKKWVLDPVGASATRLRRSLSKRLLLDFHPTVLRGNPSEIMALCGIETDKKGVDSTRNSDEALQAAIALSGQTGAVVSVSGEVDIVTDSLRVIRISGGSPLMRQVTGMGCSASAITAAFLAGRASATDAASHAMLLMKAAGEQAAASACSAGSFQMHFLDSLSHIESTGSLEDHTHRLWIEKI